MTNNEYIACRDGNEVMSFATLDEAVAWGNEKESFEVYNEDDENFIANVQSQHGFRFRSKRLPPRRLGGRRFRHSKMLQRVSGW